MPVFDEKAPVGAPQQSNPIAVFLDQLAKVRAQQQGAQQTMGTMRLPGQVGGAPPSLASPLPQVGGGAGGGMPLSTAAPMGAPAPGGAIQHQAPVPGGFQTGMEFSTKAGRNGAIVQGSIANITQAIAAAKNEKQEHVKRQAENYMSQIMAAQQAGDKATLDLLLKDPKVIKTLEKGLDYIMPKTPGEPPPPEAQGVHAAMTKAQQKQAQQAQANSPLPAPNTPGGVAIPQMSQVKQNDQQTELALSEIRKQALAGNPQMAQMVALGVNPADVLKMDQEQMKTALTIAKDLSVADSQLRGDIVKATASKDVAAMRKEAVLAQVNMMKSYHQDLIKWKTEAKKGSDAFARAQLTTLKDQINQRTALAEKIRKENPDQAAMYDTQAAELQKKYDAVSDANDTSMEKILQDLMGNKTPEVQQE